MKTTNSAIGSAVHAGTLDEIVFENRNHEYGAYYLRKKYSNHLFVALLFIALLFGSSSFVALWKYMQLPPPEVVIDKPFILPPEPIIDEDFNKIKLPEVQITQAAATTPQFVVPTVVDNPTEATGTTNNVNILLPDDVGNNGGLSTIAPVTLDNVIDAVDTGFRSVEIQAMFEGGDFKNFNKWVQKNVSFPNDASQNDLSGSVYVNFAVNNKGDVCDIEIVRSPHPVFSKEVINTIKKSPKWIPAKQNGKDVKQLFSMRIKFADPL